MHLPPVTYDCTVDVGTERLLFYYVIAMKKDFVPLQYIAALEEKLTEQVRVNRELLKTVIEQNEEIIRLRNRLKEGRTEIVLDELLRMDSTRGEA